jgi:hypothetical protein
MTALEFGYLDCLCNPYGWGCNSGGALAPEEMQGKKSKPKEKGELWPKQNFRKLKGK